MNKWTNDNLPLDGSSIVKTGVFLSSIERRYVMDLVVLLRDQGLEDSSMVLRLVCQTLAIAHGLPDISSIDEVNGLYGLDSTGEFTMSGSCSERLELLRSFISARDHGPGPEDGPAADVFRRLLDNTKEGTE